MHGLLRLRILETHANITADWSSIAIAQSAEEIQQLAQRFDGEYRRERRLSGPCPIGVGPCARHFHWGSVSKTHNHHLFVGIEYFEFLVV